MRRIHHHRLGLFAAGTALVVATTSLTAIAPTAHASGCTVRSGASYTSHTAWVMGVSLACNYMGVRHRYDPVWSNSNYYTSWSGGYVEGTPYYSEYAPSLLWHETKYW